MRSLFLINLITVLIVSGCVSVKPRHLDAVPGFPATNCQPPTFFTNSSFQKALFKASMDIGKVHLTGLVFVKMIRDPGSGLHEGGVADRGSYFRVVFSNELGMTYFDFEISSRTTRVVFCFEPLNK